MLVWHFGERCHRERDRPDQGPGRSIEDALGEQLSSRGRSHLPGLSVEGAAGADAGAAVGAAAGAAFAASPRRRIGGYSLMPAPLMPEPLMPEPLMPEPLMSEPVMSKPVPLDDPVTPACTHSDPPSTRHGEPKPSSTALDV